VSSLNETEEQEPVFGWPFDPHLIREYDQNDALNGLQLP